MSKKATMAAMAELHRQMAEVLGLALQGEVDEEGNTRPPSAAVLAQVNAFLKNNNISADVENDPATKALAEAAHKLPFQTQVDEDGHPISVN